MPIDMKQRFIQMPLDVEIASKSADKQRNATAFQKFWQREEARGTGIDRGERIPKLLYTKAYPYHLDPYRRAEEDMLSLRVHDIDAITRKPTKGAISLYTKPLQEMEFHSMQCNPQRGFFGGDVCTS